MSFRYYQLMSTELTTEPDEKTKMNENGKLIYVNMKILTSVMDAININNRN